MQQSLQKNSGFIWSFAFVCVAASLSGCATNGLKMPFSMASSDLPTNAASASAYGLDDLEAKADALELVIEETGDEVVARQKLASHEPLGLPVTNRVMRPSNQYASTQVRTKPATASNSDVVVRGQSPTVQDSNVQPAAYQYPETQVQQNAAPGSFFNNPPSGLQFPSINTGAPNEVNPIIQPQAPGGLAQFPQNYADVDIYVSETQTGRINFGGAYNSDNGIVGQFTIDERNFDIWRFPRSLREIVDGTAWRGAGQTFRLELVPGADVQRYLVSFGEPYLFNTPVSLTASAYLFDRQYFDWDEERLGGRIALGYRLTHDISVSAGFRGENVSISDLRLNTSPSLNAAEGDTDLFVAHVGLVRDTRDHPFLATEGSYLSLTYHQAFGEFDYARGDLDYRRYRLLYQRPDGSGRHTLSYGTKLGFSGEETPVFENYFAGGFSTMRGFDFRGASPVEGDVRTGGRFQWLNSLEYMFPLTADDMIKGVVFCDFGTVEQDAKINDFRVAPGFGFRIHMPAAGIGAPLAFDFAFPTSKADTDETQVFSFYLGVLR